MSEFIERLRTGAEELGIQISDDVGDQFKKHYEYMIQRNKQMNLTTITDWRDAVDLHYIDSIALTKYYNLKGCRVIDIGSGAGFPGIPIKILIKEMELTILDATEKRINFIREICEQIGLRGVTSQHGRAEEIAHNEYFRERYDYAISRAVARMNVLAEISIPYIRVGGYFLALKSVDTRDEIEEAREIIERLGCEYEGEEDYRIPGTEVEHRVVIIRKVNETGVRYPRRYSRIVKGRG